MGQLRFLVPRPEQIDPDAVGRAYMAGIDDIPWRTKVTWDGKELSVERGDNDSGYLYVPWRVAGQGQITLSTATLMERDTPYHLPVELARGTLNRLRNQQFGWEAVGLSPSANVGPLLQTAIEHFGRAALGQNIDVWAAADDAQAAIDAAFQAMGVLTDDYIEQSVSARRKGTAKLPTLIGAAVDNSLLEGFNVKEFSAAFDTACVPMVWRDIERQQGRFDWTQVDRQIAWCQAQEIRGCAGPLIQLSREAAPDWIALWEGDFDHLLSFATTFVHAAVHRYRGKVTLWNAAAGLNVAGVLDLSEEQQLRLAAYALEALRKNDPRGPIMLSIDQPWSEYMARRELDLSPLHFADALARADLGLAGLCLDLNFGFSPNATLPRDWLEVGRQLDRWTTLGLPLIVSPTLPEFRGEANHEAAQAEWVQRFLGLLLAKPAVQAIFWRVWQDEATPGDWENGGLVDVIGQPKKAVKICSQIRRTYL